MKKITLLTLVALFVATAGLAKDGPRKLTALKTTHPISGLQDSKTATRTTLQRKAATTLGEVLQRQSRAPRRTAMITDQPEGEYVVMSRSGDAYASTLFGVFYTEVSGKVCEVVFGADNKVYMKNIITQYDTGAWIEGTLSGSTINFQLPQPIYDEMGDTYYAMMMQLSGDTYVKASSQNLTGGGHHHLCQQPGQRQPCGGLGQ